MKIVSSSFVLTVILLTLFGSYRKLRPQVSFCGDTHAIWAQSVYLRGYNPRTGAPLTKADITNLAELVRVNKIRYLYLFAGPYQKDGSLPEYSFSQTAIDSIAEIKRLVPEVKILPWIGGLQDVTVFLDDKQWINTALEATAKLLTTLQLDGAHINLEYVLPTATEVISERSFVESRMDGADYRVHFVDFMKQVRNEFPDLYISTVVPSTTSLVRGWKLPSGEGEMLDLLAQVDQLALMFYDTSIDNNELYQRAVMEQLRDIQRWKKVRGSGTEILLSI